MIPSALLFTILLSQNSVLSYELNNVIPRLNCYNNVQPNCSTNLTTAYPEYSRSASNQTEADTWFHLFTCRNKTDPEKLHKCAGNLTQDTNYNCSQKLIIILNPFIAGICEVAVYREWRTQILKNCSHNVLEVDYSWGNQIDYGTARENGPIVAHQVAFVIGNIKGHCGKNISVHIIGHSLGAQIAGLIGQLYPIEKITALDPAGPGYFNRSANESLDMTDAKFVEVWFCNKGSCLPNLGTEALLGHVNININGGRIQKACEKYAYVSIAKQDYVYGFGTAMMPTLCYHAHCAQYYKVAINQKDCKFVAVRCDNDDDFNSGRCKCGTDGHNCIVMGFETEKYAPSNITSPQIYYIDTTDKCPYCVQNASWVGNFTDPYP